MILDVPQYYQSKDDYACGPMAVRMVADYYFKKENREMTATQWLSILDITMNNNIRRKSGTRKENVERALAELKFATQLIQGSDFNSKIQSIREALNKKCPVIVYCVTKPNKSYPHFAVIVGIDDDSVYIRDPYPRERNTKRPRKIPFKVFSSASPEVGELVWGRSKWGIEVIKK
jgi:predicted double-glycine peptidase